MQYIEPVFQIVSTVMMLVFGTYFLCRSFNQSVEAVADKKRCSDRTQYRIEDLERITDDLNRQIEFLRSKITEQETQLAEKPKESPFPALLSSLLGMISKLSDLDASNKDEEEEPEDTDNPENHE